MTVNNTMPASDKQKGLMMRLDIPFKNDITMSEAAALIKTALDKKNEGQPKREFSASTSLPSRAGNNSDGARCGMCVNNAVQLYLAGKLVMDKNDVDLYQPIARCAATLIKMCKELEKK